MKRLKLTWRPNVLNCHFSTSSLTRLQVSSEESTRKPETGTNQLRYNSFGVQMISASLFKQLFSSDSKYSVDEDKVRECLGELKKYNLLNSQESMPNVDLKLPKLYGGSIEEHFYRIGKQQSQPYTVALEHLLRKVPAMPKEWSSEVGWTKYSENGAEKVDYPEEDALVFDVEICSKESDLPVMATAVSTEAWYSWVSAGLYSGFRNLNKHSASIDYLIPLESSSRARGYNLSGQILKPRIAVGHSVSFDRARVKEQYWIERTGMRFLDTLSLHVCVSGITSYQKALIKAGIGSNELTQHSSSNSLSNVHKLYCGTEISKEEREIFISGSLQDVRDNFQVLMTYCANDVKATHSVFTHLFPLFRERFPHPVTLAGMLELQSAYLPVNYNWNRYLFEAEQSYEDLNLEAKKLLTRSANEACRLLHGDKYKQDLWLWDQDWDVKNLALKKTPVKTSAVEIEEDEQGANDFYSEADETLESLDKKFEFLFKKREQLPARPPHLPGYPGWYRKLCEKPNHPEWVPGPDLIGTGMQVAPKLLKLTWNLMPVHFIRGKGWGFLVPFETDILATPAETVPINELTEHTRGLEALLCSCEKCEHSCGTNEQFLCTKTSEKRIVPFCRKEIGQVCGFVRLPHKDGSMLNVGNPLARDFLNKFSENQLSGSEVFARRIIEISRMVSYWRNNKDRIEQQFVGWLSKKDLPPHLQSFPLLGAILPQVTVCGTLTRRAVEPTWMTASNAMAERIGSELRGMVQAPPGYSLVGADVDSQELWIASVLGDAHAAKLHGATPLGWMTLNGQKADGTDMHSVTAKAVGISRGDAKVLNYARIYGAGIRFSEGLLKQFNPEMSEDEARQKANKMFSITKGKKLFRLKEGVLSGFGSREMPRYAAQSMCALYSKSVDEIFHPPQWKGGSESAMFNALEEIALRPSPETPFLSCKLSRALEVDAEQSSKLLPTKINWVVQSGAVDFLHLMLTCMRWLLGPQSRFCLSFHDEVRYLVPEEHKYKAALALHVTNLLTRAFCVSRLGMTDLPQSVAFFSSVEIDQALRKESHDDQKTPSNPFGLSRGYGIHLGESLNIYQAIEKAEGNVGIVSRKKTNTADLKDKSHVHQLLNEDIDLSLSEELSEEEGPDSEIQSGLYSNSSSPSISSTFTV